MSPLKGVSKGNKFAQQVADFFGTERRVLAGIFDKGDLVFRKWVVEVKCPGRGQPLNLSTAMNEAKTEGRNAGCPTCYAVVTRRTGYPLEEAFFTIPLWKAKELGIVE